VGTLGDRRVCNLSSSMTLSDEFGSGLSSH
jgi:hypothetical protein